MRLEGKVAVVVGADVLDKLTAEVVARKLDPYSAADELLKRFGIKT